MTLPSDLRDGTLRGTFVHAPASTGYEVIEDAVISIDAAGAIAEVGRGRAADLEIPAGMLMIPGLVDLHVHAPQYPQLGQALDEPLEVWLQKYTFPLEARYADLGFAAACYEALVADLLGCGTTTAVYFATQDLAASKLLADVCIEYGQRALVGKVAMDDPAACPDDYRDASAEAAIAGTRALIDYIRTHPDNTDGRVLPAITPRFIPSCTDAALAGLGALAAETGAHVQTHCSESDWEHAHVLARCGVTDTAALDRFGLLTRRTILAHGVFVDDDDMDTIAARGAAIAHCAASNAYFGNAVFPLRRALEKGLHVGLGTDISGGPVESVLKACRATVLASRMLEEGVDPALPRERRGRPGSRVSMATAFHLATAGGGIALDLPIGRFAPGCRFDAILLDPGAPLGTMRTFGESDPAVVVEKALHTASRANLAATYVDGREVQALA